MIHIINESIRSKASDTEPNQHYFFDGNWWLQDSYKAWQSAFPWLTKRTIGQYLRDLCTNCYHDGDKCEGDVCKYPCLLKTSSSTKAGNKMPNFYRPNPEWTPDTPREKISLPPLGKNFPQGREKISSPREKFSSSSLSNNQTTNPAKSTTADYPQDHEADEAAEVLAYYESQFGRSGRRAREEFKRTYCTESSGRKEEFIKNVDEFRNCVFLKPTTHSPMRLFHAEQLLVQRKTMRFGILNEIRNGMFDRKMTINRLIETDESLQRWFAGDKRCIEDAVYSMLEYC